MQDLNQTLDDMFAAGEYAEAEAWMLAQRGRLAACQRAGGDAVVGDSADIRAYIAVCNELGSFYRERGRLDESKENYDEALAKTEELEGTRRTAGFAVLLVNAAGTYRYMGDFAHAHANYDEAEETLLALGMSDTFEYASLLNNRALCMLDEGVQFEQALGFATQAAEIVGRLRPGRTDEAIAQVNLASMALRAGEFDKAGRHAGRAVEIYESLDETTGHYPAALNVAAAAALYSGGYEEALAGFERAAEYTKRNFGENRDYASALRNMALAYAKMGEEEKAAELLRRVQEPAFGKDGNRGE